MWDRNPYAESDFVAFVRSIYSEPSAHNIRLVMSDWLMDQGVEDFKALEAVELPVWSNVLPVDYFGRGIGSGIGSGIGRGIGSGSGRGIGIGIGIGIGSGRGSGSGSGIGIGSGSGIGRSTIVEQGKAYLITTVDWFAWVGRMVRQVGPWEYKFESCSKVVDTRNGDCWEEMAEGNKAARKRAEYKHYKVPVILGMGVVAKILWVGETPQEQGL